MHGTASECPGTGPGCISAYLVLVHTEKITKSNCALQSCSTRDFLEFLTERIQPFSIDSAGFPCRDPAIPSPHSFHGVKICSVE